MQQLVWIQDARDVLGQLVPERQRVQVAGQFQLAVCHLADVSSSSASRILITRSAVFKA